MLDLTTNDYNVYTANMNKSMYDKLFFVDKIDTDEVDTLVDYGCADGSFIQAARQFLPDFKFLGYDIDPTMLKLADAKIPDGFFTNDWNKIKNRINIDKAVLNLSSVIHEVYSYCNETEIQEFWDRVFNSGFKYITIRDMVKTNYLPLFIIDRFVDFEKRLISDPDLYANYGQRWASFKQYWDVADQRQIIHFLMKYRYKKNWGKEVKENYIPLTYREIIDKIPQNYKIIYTDCFTLTYLKRTIRHDFDIDLTEIPTHMKFVLRKKD